jgi:hypothetical protein
VARIQRAVANTVVGQQLPPGVVKGGTAIKLRVGEAGSRFTPDLDVSPRAGMALDQYIADFQDRLFAGWGGFTGTVEALDPPHPEGVPDEYVMRPYRIALAYKGRHWLSVTFEVGHDEVGSTSSYETRIADDLVMIFDRLALDVPGPVPVMALDHQMAQKLHACTSRNPRTDTNERAHDLVDLQILADDKVIDLAAVGATARRLFAARRSQPWPPTVVAFERWPDLYENAAEGLGVLAGVDEAVAWANDLIAHIVETSG